MNHSKNLVRIKAVYNALGPLRDHVVFVGGATVAFYVDQMVEEVRSKQFTRYIIQPADQQVYVIMQPR